MYRGQKVSLILPAFNEKENISRAISSFASIGLFDEILVVDNNSTDNTGGIARQTQARVINETRQGYGFALRRGLAEAKGDLLVLSEPDGTFFPSDARRLLSQTVNADLVLGSRTHSAYIKPRANMGFLLRYGNFILAKIIQFLYHTPPLSDCGCTFRVISKPAARKIISSLHVGGSHFLPEMVIQVVYHGLKITEIPVHYGPRVGRSKITGSKIKSLLVGLRMAGVVFSRLCIH
jgi:glycosyltransferase involved in cell wall biosynthesis